MIEDRSFRVPPGRNVATAWVNIDWLALGCRDRMDFAAIERAGRNLVQHGGFAPWPPIVGHWEPPRFVVDDGRHEFLAALALGRTHVFVAWLAEFPETDS